MPRLTTSTPSYRKHKGSGQALVTLSGKDFYLGKYGTKASHTEYDRLTSEWLASNRKLSTLGRFDLTVKEIIARYWQFAETHYVMPSGEPSGELANIKSALRLVKQLYADRPASEFGPLALKALQLKMIDADWARSTINSATGKIKRVFKWAESEELIPPGRFHALQTVTGLQRGRTTAREPDRVLPVSDQHFQATLPKLPTVIADMARFARLTGARPTEVCIIRPCDVDATGDVWTYRPSAHKTKHTGRERRIFIGPKAQIILQPYLLREKSTFCFSPKDSERKRKRAMREGRKTPVQPSQIDRRKKKPALRPGNRYTKDGFSRAIRRACDAAGVPRWRPNQLRHAAATDIRSQFGLEASQTILGHASANITQVYAERDFGLAASVVKKIG